MKISGLPRRSTVLLPLSVILALGLSAAVKAELQPEPAKSSAQTAPAEADSARIDTRVKSCASPCRHRPSSMR